MANISVVRIGVHVQHPYLFECALNSHLRRTPRCPYPGLEAQQFQMIFEAAGVPFKLVNTKMNPAASAAANLDTLLSCDDRHRYFGDTLSKTIYSGGWCAIDSDQALITESLWLRAFNFINVFNTSVWTFLLIMYGLLSLYPFLSNCFYHRRGTMNKSRAVLVGLLSVFTLNLYQNGLLTQLLLIPQPTYLFVDTKSMAQSIASGKRLFIMENSETNNFLDQVHRANKSETISTRYELKQALRKHPGTTVALVGGFKAAMRMIADRKALMVTDSFDCAYIRSTTCGTRVIQLDGFHNWRCGMSFSQSSDPFMIEIINKTIMDIDSVLNGIQVRYEKMWKQRSLVCHRNIEQERNVLHLDQVAGVFVLLITGLITAFIIMLFEQCSLTL